MTGATDAMDGLTFYLYNVSSEGSGAVASVSAGELQYSGIHFYAGELQYSGIHFYAGESKTSEYRLTDVWADNGKSGAQTALAQSGETFPIHITVTAQSSN